MEMREELMVGDEVVFFEGKKNKPVAYMWDGKVILCKHKIPLGYAKILTVEDKERYYLVTAEHIVKDVYSEIDYDDFIRVLPLHGFKLGYDKTFQANHWDEGIKTEHQIFAYNPENKVVIVANTFTTRGRQKFNTIETYCPGLNIFNYNRNKTVSHGSSLLTVFDLERGYSLSDLLAWVSKQMDGVDSVWPKNEYPSLWTYEDKGSYDDNGNWNLGKSNLKKLLDAPIEVLNVVFKGCNWAESLINEIVTAYNGVQ